jgi:molybdopterin-binding protein
MQALGYRRYVAEYRLGQAAEILGVSVDTLRRWADEGRLATERTRGGHRLVDGAELAGLAAQLGRFHEPEAITAQSARNRFPGIVTRVIRDKVMSQVEMQAGPHRVVSLMSTEAADELGLSPGVRALAAVKATNVVIELPSER